MSDDAGKPAVIGEQQQAFRVDVEPAHRHHAGQVLGQVVEHGGAAFRILRRGHEAARLVVEPQAGALLGGQGLPVHGDRVGGGHVDGGALQHLAVEGHAAFGDQNLRVPTRRDAGAGDHLGDAVLCRFLRLRLDCGALLAGAGRALLGRPVEAARALVAVAAAEGAISLIAAGPEGLVAALGTGTARALVIVPAAERLVSRRARLARAVVVATGAEGAVAAFAGLAEGPVTGGAAAVGASRRTAPAIIVVAVGHESLIAEEW
jgi:hypothetical protein